MKLSVVIPVYNEERYVADVVRRVFQVKIDPRVSGLEVIVVDDCSTDSTPRVLEQVVTEFPIRVMRHAQNRGKGAALRTGFQNVSGDLVVVQDADLEYNPSEFNKLLQPILNDLADVVYGSRFAGGEPHRVLYFWHSVGNQVLTVLSNMFTDLNLSDMETCYKAFRRDILRSIQLEEDRFGIEPEITAKVARLAKRGECRIFEVGISYAGRTYAEGKKIGLKDGFSALRCILKYNLLR